LCADWPVTSLVELTLLAETAASRAPCTARQRRPGSSPSGYTAR
jgi:hypothetical protein